MLTASQRQHWKAWIRRYGRQYLQDPEITSVGIGLKVTDGVRSEEPCIQFTVREKLDVPTLETLGREVIPESLSTRGDSLPTDVVERGYALAYEIVPEAFDDSRRRRVDPLVPGVSISHPSVSAGTLGAIVYDTHTGRPAVLSNWHVLHGPDGVIGDPALQPGTHDDNRDNAANRFGALLRSHLGVAGDGALASVEDRGVDPELLDVGVTPAEIADPDLGDKVIKSGRTTGVSHGVVTRIDTLVSFTYGTAEETIGCFEIEADPNRTEALDMLSDGGDSGAVWMLKAANGHPSGVMGGVHFAGSDSPAGETALACYASSLRDKLKFTLDAASPAVEKLGLGFDEDFLEFSVAFPALDPEVAADAVEVEGSTVIDYTHFSLTQSKSRRLARLVAWNVDGSDLKRLSRDGISFRFDERFPRDFQAGEDLYRANDLDRGHIARRSDLLWGPREEAQRANEDSFHFPNIAPQMNDFNQSGRSGVWGELEDSLFAQVDVEKLRISVMGGPVFHDSDREYRGYLLPREFFKVLYYVADGRLKARAFLLTQELTDLEVLDFREFETYEVSFGELEQRTGLGFVAPAATESISAPRLLRSTAEIGW